MPQALAILQLGQGLKMSWAVPSGAFPLRDFPHATATAQSPPTRVPSPPGLSNREVATLSLIPY